MHILATRRSFIQRSHGDATAKFEAQACATQNYHFQGKIFILYYQNLHLYMKTDRGRPSSLAKCIKFLVLCVAEMVAPVASLALPKEVAPPASGALFAVLLVVLGHLLERAGRLDPRQQAIGELDIEELCDATDRGVGLLLELLVGDPQDLTLRGGVSLPPAQSMLKPRPKPDLPRHPELVLLSCEVDYFGAKVCDQY